MGDFFPSLSSPGFRKFNFCMTLVLEALIYITLAALWSFFIVHSIAEKQDSFTDRIYCSFFPNCFWHMPVFWFLHHCYQ